MERNAGYHTRQKAMIYQYILDNRQRHITATDIASFLAAEGTPVGIATIYRYLDKLVEQGEIRKYIMDEKSSACYQYVEEHTTGPLHFHLKCVRCGKLIHTDCSYLQQIDRHILEHHGFHVDHSKTVFYGVCQECSQTEEDKK